MTSLVFTFFIEWEILVSHYQSMKFFSCTHLVISIQSNFVYYALYKRSNNYSDRKPNCKCSQKYT